MPAYQVNFENNNAVSAQQVPILAFDELKKLRNEGSKVVMEWYIVDADHEHEAMETANALIRKNWSSVLGIKSC